MPPDAAAPCDPFAEGVGPLRDADGERAPSWAVRWDARGTRWRRRPMDDWLSLVLIIAALVVLALVTFSVAQRRHIAKKRRR
ncbi:hypothetical protein GCM10023328_21090 [Modestobacter marinus]|uniref:Uncharacterized protein n=2 Tax=Modestobacter marinus TaxID=477641 RepID=A0ABQ2FZ92_9ACTN|nr:hypothetical protein GCM10011589_23300 [Modestobacter marinus]